MQINIHQTHHTIADFSEIFTYLDQLSKSPDFENNIHIFPELFMTGYPLQDLCLQRDFINKYHDFFDRLKLWWSKLNIKSDTALLIGGLDYSFEDGVLKSIENVIFELSNKENLKSIYTKCLLPNYDIFDEAKYFNAGTSAKIWEFAGKKFGLLICEDMWHSPHYSIDPVKELFNISSQTKLNGIFNFSASPFYLDKETSRLKRASEISQFFNVPFYYVNRVGSEDEIIFDGGSFVVDGNKILAKANSFQKEVLKVDIFDEQDVPQDAKLSESRHSWESLFTPWIETTDKGPRIMSLTDEHCEQALHALRLGIHDYADKCGMKKFLIALSGGMDSALVLTLIRLFLREDQEVEAVYMPSQFSATLSWDLSAELCKNLGVKLTSLPIKFLHSSVKNQFSQSFEEMEGLADENIQSRLRGALLYARSNQTGAMVLNTSNKSELAVGYSTLYGDSVGAISVLGDLYKSEVYTLAQYINKKFNNIIPEQIITRPPSAELREDQEDQQSLPPYEILDTILEGHLSYQYGQEELIEMGLPEEDVKKAIRLCNISEYKRYQFCPVIKLKSKSFGFGRRMPICKRV